jgi:hypothetical protein
MNKRRSTRSTLIACFLTFACSTLAWSEQVTFKVKHQFRANPDSTRVWWLIENGAVLGLDDSARRLTVTHKQNPLDLGFDAVEKVIFEQTTHIRGGGWGNLFASVGLGPIGSMIDRKAVSDYWCYIEYRAADGIHGYMLEIPKELSAAVIDKMKAMLGDKVSSPRFIEPLAVVKVDTLTDTKSSYDYDADSKVHPLPEPKPDKALVLVVCPLIDNPVNRGPLVKLHANDHVVAVNNWGSYAFAYLDPGDYVLASEIKGTASTLRIRLEAGQSYYFLEDIVDDDRVVLSRHTKELVMHQVTGARYADWKKKN